MSAGLRLADATRHAGDRAEWTDAPRHARRWVAIFGAMFCVAALLLPFVGPFGLSLARVYAHQEPDWSILVQLRVSRTLLGLFAGGALVARGRALSGDASGRARHSLHARNLGRRVTWRRRRDLARLAAGRRPPCDLAGLARGRGDRACARRRRGNSAAPRVVVRPASLRHGGQQRLLRLHHRHLRPGRRDASRSRSRGG